jgi:hypothetical protein
MISTGSNSLLALTLPFALIGGVFAAWLFGWRAGVVGAFAYVVSPAGATQLSIARTTGYWRRW